MLNRFPQTFSDSFQAQAAALIASTAVGGWAVLTVLMTWGSDALQVILVTLLFGDFTFSS